MREPDFFLVGAPKCGTTALFEMIGAHPEVFVSDPKEPDFFATDVLAAARPRGAVRDWEAYLRLFASADGAVAAGEGSVSYLASRAAAAALHARLPHARILMVLRNPADRVFAHYTAARASGAAGVPFTDWLRQSLDREQAGAPVGPITPGRYATHLARFRTHFPVQQIHLVWHEDFVRDPEGVLRGIFVFLGVTSPARVPSDLRANETRVPVVALPTPIRRVITAALPPAVIRRIRQWSSRPVPWTMAPEEREAASRVYADEVRALAGMTGRPLDHWLPGRS